ncbi:MAG TPA: CocE/NonD family hydrolase [Dehalococcoidia bacterium]|nr:CocE/NonD family hydrolase [Dehalococcoidia bacterium]
MPEAQPEVKRIVKKEKFGEEEIEVVYREMRKPVSQMSKEGQVVDRFSFAPPFNPRTYLAEDGIICEQDVAVPMRDGTIIYTDIFRPVGATNIPVIISWSYFGKRPGDAEVEWQIMGVSPGTVSRMTKFESADPGYWCRLGYACANVDPRGIGHSQGDTNFFGTQDGRDGHDFIEWCAQQHWCNGKIGMFGNSGVAMTQWRIAAEQPPHLACIAPWEGTGDIYRESFFEGGIPGMFGSWVVTTLAGQGYIDDVVTMTQKLPFMNGYWEDKIPKWEKIKIPVYTTGCWNHFHLRGSVDGFRKCRSTKKWLRVHREFEWPDTYCNAGLEDLRLFFDRYLKDIRNGWELTPRVRIEVMDSWDYDYQINRPEKEFPIARTQYKKLYLDAANGTMSFDPVSKESKVSYEGQTGQAGFTIKFNEDTEITGYMKLRLWVQADGHDDMDMFIYIRKLDESGKWLPISALGEPHPGGWGKMRVSRRELDEKLSTDFQPVQAHRRELKLKPGEIVPVDIEVWPYSMIWHKGQQLEVVIAGRYIREGWFEPLIWLTNNKGNHIIHSGGKYDSYLQVPVIPPKYQAGDYIYR